jgi:hypothetical protein
VRNAATNAVIVQTVNTIAAKHLSDCENTMMFADKILSYVVARDVTVVLTMST